MAYDGTFLYVNDGAFFGTNTIYKIDPSSGAVVAQGQPIGNPGFGLNFTGLAYLNGDLYAVDLYGDGYVIDPNSFSVVRTLSLPSGLTGLAGDPDNGSLYGVAQGYYSPGTLYQIDPSTGLVVASAQDNYAGLNEQDIAYSGGQLFVSETSGPAFQGGTNDIAVYDAAGFSFLQRLPVAVLGFVSGLAGGSAAPSQDWYRFSANAGDSLDISLSLPGDATGFQSPNFLDPEFEVYDPSGTLLGTFTGAGSISLTALMTGSYEVHVLSADNTSTGEYVLNVAGATGGLDPFVVISSTPATAPWSRRSPATR